MLKTAALAAMAAVIPYVLSPVHTVNIESFPLGVLERNTLLDGAEHLFQGDVVGGCKGSFFTLGGILKDLLSCYF
eukprot:1391735-Amorphochlora_amoeboformis.AAC.1